jgi:hypothetical protein
MGHFEAFGGLSIFIDNETSNYRLLSLSIKKIQYQTLFVISSSINFLLKECTFLFVAWNHYFAIVQVNPV